MPIEIKELVVKATVVESNSEAISQETAPSNAGTIERLNKEQIIEECVEQVLSILERKKER